MLQFDVAAGVTQIPHGVAVVAPGADGAPITFETGFGLRDTSLPPPASALWNCQQGIRAYWFDYFVQCLPVGATSMFVQGCGYAFVAGQALLIETQGASPTDPPDPADRASGQQRHGTLRPAVPAGAGRRRSAVHDLPDLPARGAGTDRGDPARLGAGGRTDRGARPFGHDGDRQSRAGDARPDGDRELCDRGSRPRRRHSSPLRSSAPARAR